MKRPRLRSILSTAAFVIVVAVVWLYFAPTEIGGSTRYVVTGGTSMEPRFHTGDLALVRPAGDYKVGQIVAYWSTLLHTVVLHRIHAIHGSHYVFKGDNNDFLDPVNPTRADLLGKLWLHVPGGGRWLNFVHSPLIAAVICGLLATGLLFGFGEKQRRRKRRRNGPPGKGIPIVNTSAQQNAGRRIDFGALLTASAVAAAVFVVLGAVAFTRPASTLTPATTGYTQQVSFGYSASAPAGPVYATGTIHTGDPIFVSLVHNLGVDVNYRFVSVAEHDVSGTEKIVLRLTGQGGWSRNLILTPTTRFTGDHTSTVVSLDLSRIQKLLARVSVLTGMGGTYTISVVPEVQITGSVAGRPLNLSFDPAMNFQLIGSQLLSQGAASASTTTSSAPAASSPAALTAARPGAVGTPGSAPTALTVLGVSAKVSLLRWISIIGLLISGLAAVLFYLRKRSEPFEESFRIQAQYGHMIVPIVGGEDLGWPPVDVPSIKALVMLAESGHRLILHNRSNDVDTYMVNEEGTVYRYQVKPSKVVWGEWSDTTVTPVKAAA
ncbi:MAG: signal peptidase I [Solirubrobacterales bacterium]|nr:signal peptidase I [Solirubrobacterales bacterium]